MKNRIVVFGATVLTVAIVASVASGGTSPLTATGSKRRVNATVNTVTKLVSEPRVERKVENTQTWITEPVEASSATATMYIEEPVKPFIPVIAALTSFDCNGNNVPDTAEIANGTPDFDQDGIIDSCEYKLGDLNLNGTIDQQDVSILVGWWGIPNPQFGDLNFDGIVDANDLGIILGRFGAVTY